jgi:hypothetical protein
LFLNRGFFSPDDGDYVPPKQTAFFKLGALVIAVIDLRVLKMLGSCRVAAQLLASGVALSPTVRGISGPGKTIYP